MRSKVVMPLSEFSQSQHVDAFVRALFEYMGMTPLLLCKLKRGMPAALQTGFLAVFVYIVDDVFVLRARPHWTCSTVTFPKKAHDARFT